MKNINSLLHILKVCDAGKQTLDSHGYVCFQGFRGVVLLRADADIDYGDYDENGLLLGKEYWEISQTAGIEKILPTQGEIAAIVREGKEDFCFGKNDVVVDSDVLKAAIEFVGRKASARVVSQEGTSRKNLIIYNDIIYIILPIKPYTYNFRTFALSGRTLAANVVRFVKKAGGLIGDFVDENGMYVIVAGYAMMRFMHANLHDELWDVFGGSMSEDTEVRMRKKAHDMYASAEAWVRDGREVDAGGFRRFDDQRGRRITAVPADYGGECWVDTGLLESVAAVGDGLRVYHGNIIQPLYIKWGDGDALVLPIRH